MEDTAGKLGIVFAHKKMDAFGQLPELLWGYTVSVWSARVIKGLVRPKMKIMSSVTHPCMTYFILKARYIGQANTFFSASLVAILLKCAFWDICCPIYFHCKCYLLFFLLIF